MINDGRKIPREIENPIDNLLIDFSSFLNPGLRELGVTPNMLTAMSFVTGLISVWYVYNSNFMLGALFIFISYLFDCMDGNMARMFNMVTSFGDWFDHISDITKFSLLYIVVILNNDINKWYKLLFVCVTGVLFMLSLIHLGCQEQYYAKEEWTTLTTLKGMCTGVDFIQFSKYLGLGTYIYTMLVLLIVFESVKLS